MSDSGNWKSATNVIAIVALVISFLGNIFQFFDSNRKYTLDQARAKIEAENSESKKVRNVEHDKMVGQKISTIDSEIKYLNTQIEPYDKTIFKAQIEKKNDERDFSNARTAEGKESYRKNIELEDQSIQWATNEKSLLVNRKSALETERLELVKSNN